MKKSRMALLSIALISVILASTLVVLTQRTTAAPRDPLFEYRASWTCNAPAMPTQATAPPSVPAYRGIQFVTSWSAPTHFGIAVDSSGNVYVTDYSNSRVLKYTGTGSLITQWGSAGTGNGQFNGDDGIAVDSSGNVYVVDSGNSRVQKFTSNGVYITQWGSPGTLDGQFTYPNFIAVGPAGNVFVADQSNRIQMFTNTGVFESSVGSTGTGDGQFTFLDGLTADSAGYVYATDVNDHRIQKFRIGEFQMRFVTKWNTTGDGNGPFADMRGIAADTSGNLYVVDSDNDRIVEFDGVGNFLGSWGFTGFGPGQVNEPFNIAAGVGNVYLADAQNQRVDVFSVSDPLNAERIGLAPGEYMTSINIHNPSHSLNLSITKNFVLSTPETLNLPAAARSFTTTSFLGPGASFSTDCNEILSSLGIPVTAPAMGYVVVTTNNFNLDVNAEYSQLTGTGSSSQVVHITPGLFVP